MICRLFMLKRIYFIKRFIEYIKGTGTCFIQRNMPFSTSLLRFNIFRLFVILSLTQLYRYVPEIFLFSTATFKYTYRAPLRRIGKEYSANVAWSTFSHWNGYSEKYCSEVGKGKRADVYLELRKRRGHIFFEWNKRLWLPPTVSVKLKENLSWQNI